MTWAPETNVVDLRLAADNILGYIGDNQSEAHAWANGGTALPDYQKLYSNAAGRLGSLFPSLMILDQEDEGEEAETENGDVLLTGLKLTFECTVTGSDPDELVLTTKKYDMALKSMLANIPSATITANGLVTAHAWVKQIGTKYDILRGQKTANSFLQIFQTQVIYKLLSTKEG